MPRKDYDEIKNKFKTLVEQIKYYKTDKIDELCDPEVQANFSTSHDRYGEQGGLAGIKKFIDEYPRTDHLQTGIYNFACNLKDDQAQQLAYVACIAQNEVDGKEELDYFLHGLMFVNHWVKKDGSWRIDSMKMELYDGVGELQEYFEKTWYVEKRKATGILNGEHPLMIVGELDSPWLVIPEPEDVLTETEKIKDSINQYNFGIDFFVFDHLERVFAEDFHCTGTTLFVGNHKRDRIALMRAHRQINRVWCHGYKFESIEIDGNKAKVVAKRVLGHRQPGSEYIWKKGKETKEHTRAFLHLDMVKNNGMWQMQQFEYETEIVECGDYSKDYYGDLV